MAHALTAPEAWPSRDARRRRALAIALVAVLGAAAGALCVGATMLSPMRGLAIVIDALAPSSADPSDQVAKLVLTLRLPRVLLAALVGAALATSGAALQGLLRNPLADPGIIGMSAGGTLGAVIAIMLGSAATPLLRTLGTSASAFLGALLAMAVVMTIATRRGQTSTLSIVLAGVAVGSLCGALTGLALYTSDDRQLRDITVWMLGSIAGASWATAPGFAPLLLLPTLALLLVAAPLNALVLGEREASMLGIRIQWLKLFIVLAAALAVGAAAALAGLIAFVGLVTPHLVRLVFGADQRIVLPASALLGAALMMAADAAARSLVAPAELPVGILTSLLGAPFFIWLLRRARRALAT